MDRKVFVDTMVFLHFRPLRELDLPTRVQSDSVTLVVPRITLRELDKHKSIHLNRKVRERARRVLTELETAIANGTPLNGGIAVEYFPDHPADQLVKMNLNPEWADDVLVAAVAAYMDATSNTDIIVVSQDTGVRLTCRHYEIATLELDGSVALPEDLDETERENRALRQEVQRLQNAMPRLEAVFDGSEDARNIARFTVGSHPAVDEQELCKYLAEIRAAYPKKSVPGELPANHPFAGSLSSAVNMMAQFSPGVISAERIRRYNSELEMFYADAESHFRHLHDFREPKSRTISFTIAIQNTGTAPADDVDVLFLFPDGFRLLAEDDLPEEPKPPAPPQKPLSHAEELTRSMDYIYSPTVPQLSLSDIRPASSFRIKETNSYEVSEHFPRIKHGIPAILPTMYIEFPSLSEAKSFKCTYELRPANLASPSTGELHFVIENKDA